MDCYFFVDEDGTENVSNLPPKRHKTEPFWIVTKECKGKEVILYDAITELPQSTIEALFRVKLTWADNPIKITWHDTAHMLD
jgi:hypothetical protein